MLQFPKRVQNFGLVILCRGHCCIQRQGPTSLDTAAKNRATGGLSCCCLYGTNGLLYEKSISKLVAGGGYSGSHDLAAVVRLHREYVFIATAGDHRVSKRGDRCADAPD